MIQKLSHTSIFCLNQEEALEFYTEKLGLEVRTNAEMGGGFRWVTVGPKGQPDLEIALMEVRPGMMFSEESANQMKDLIEKGTFGVGVFETADCRETVKDLEEKGVRVMQPPTERPYGLEALIRDNSGNWFSLCQKK